MSVEGSGRGFSEWTSHVLHVLLCPGQFPLCAPVSPTPWTKMHRTIDTTSSGPSHRDAEDEGIKVRAAVNKFDPVAIETSIWLKDRVYYTVIYSLCSFFFFHLQSFQFCIYCVFTYFILCLYLTTCVEYSDKMTNKLIRMYVRKRIHLSHQT